MTCDYGYDNDYAYFFRVKVRVGPLTQAVEAGVHNAHTRSEGPFLDEEVGLGFALGLGIGLVRVRVRVG